MPFGQRYLAVRTDTPRSAPPLIADVRVSQVQLPGEPDRTREPGPRSKGALMASRVRPARNTTIRPPTRTASTGGKLCVARATTAQEAKRATGKGP